MLIFRDIIIFEKNKIRNILWVNKIRKRGIMSTKRGITTQYKTDYHQYGIVVLDLSPYNGFLNGDEIG
jgi:hypothetical protein